MSHGIGIKLEDGESISSALKRFKRLVRKNQIIEDCLKHRHFTKPSTLRRRKLKKAISRKQKLSANTY